MHPVLEAAVLDARATFGEGQVTFTELGDGSVKVTILDQAIGSRWVPQVVSISTTLLVSFPANQPYPFYIPGGLRPADGRTVSNLNNVTLEQATVGQLSVRPLGGRRVESFSSLIAGVVSWLRSH